LGVSTPECVPVGEAGPEGPPRAMEEIAELVALRDAERFRVRSGRSGARVRRDARPGPARAGGL
jgi:hypothetical protein